MTVIVDIKSIVDCTDYLTHQMLIFKSELRLCVNENKIFF